MTKITRTKERIKQTGEVFTPLELVDEILSKLPDDVWLPDKTFIDPACGDGNFLVRVVAWKIWLGADPDRAVETTYGVDLMPDNVGHARSRVLTAAWAATTWHHHNGYDTVSPQLTTEYERIVGVTSGCVEFAGMMTPVVEHNIVCHNALTWDYDNWQPPIVAS